MPDTTPDTDTDSDTDTELTEYRLQEGMTRVVRAGLVLEGDETVAMHPTEAAVHDDVLEPVDETGAADDATEADDE